MEWRIATGWSKGLPGHSVCFLLEAGAKVVRRDIFWLHELDGTMDRMLAVENLVDIGHATSARPFRDLVWTEGGTGKIGHGRRT